MQNDNFEKCFSDFIDRREYDVAKNALFSIVRSSFRAGWESAGGNPPAPQPPLHIADTKPKK
jgi:hypothetical protein